MESSKNLQKLAKLVRYWILYMTTRAGSGHATSALSATDIMTYLFFEKLRFDIGDPHNQDNDKVIFSKGHASPLLYALWTAAGAINEDELDNYRQFKSKLEGHPTVRFEYVDVATGSLGQGLSAGLGMALAQRARISNFKFQISNLPIIYVLMGDSEVAEGSCWEAMEVASYYKVGNLVGIIDVNRLGQSTETMLGWDIERYAKRIEAFGWDTVVCDGHDFADIEKAFNSIDNLWDKPKMVIAKTVKGKGVSFLQDKEGWHGKALKQDEFEKAVKELGKVDKSIRGEIRKPDFSARGVKNQINQQKSAKISRNQIANKQSLRSSPAMRVAGLRSESSDLSGHAYRLGEEIATRKAYGQRLTELGRVDPRIVALDGETSNSTFSEIFKKEIPERYFEMFIAEQNMVGVACGMSKMGFVPFVSTFSAFFTRAYDQIRMAAISLANVKFVGSHAGVSIGEDGPSQMGLEDISLFRTVSASKVFCPADAVSCAKIVEIAANNNGLFYIRTQRPDTPVIYKNNQNFKIGGSNIVRSSKNDKALVVACGICVIEAIKAADLLYKQGVNIRVMDAYSIKPIDEIGLKKHAKEAGGSVLTCEDHYVEGGLGDAVLNAFANNPNVRVHKLAVSKLPMSGKPGDLMNYEGIDAESIVVNVVKILK